ncbi:MAG: fumA, partial [Rhodospirillales bacterium]|nr:fumA [Rhodospirillales bacterium]
MLDSAYHPLLPATKDTTEYRKLTDKFVQTIDVAGRKILKIEAEGIAMLTQQAFSDCSHLLRTAHLEQLAKILKDPEASDNDRFVALDLLKNANIAAGRILPMCQDTGTALVMGKRGQNVWIDGDDEAAISEGVMRTYEHDNLRYSQMAPLDMYEEVNTDNNL